jgi:hypothetical protein
LALLGGSPAKAGFTFEFDHDLNSGSGLTPNTPGGPFATARFEDINTNPNQVSITVTNLMAPNEPLGEFKPRITQLAFNTQPFLGGSNIEGGTQSPGWQSTYTADNAQSIDGGGNATKGFDLLLTSSPGITNGIRPGEVVTFIVTDITAAGSSDFSTSSFLATNSEGYFAAAKVQGIGGQDRSTQIVVRRNPIPAPIPVFGAAMAFAYSRGLRRRLNQGTHEQVC